MFVVITLVTGKELSRKNGDGIATFSTPTVMHFAAALLVSAILSAPWRTLTGAAILTGLAGLCGGAYILRNAFRTKALEQYTADLEDWIWYNVLPFVAYGALLAGGTMLKAVPLQTPFVLGGAVLTLIFLGIRNAWDVVTYIAIGGPTDSPER